MPRKRVGSEEQERAARLASSLRRRQANLGLTVQDLSTNSNLGYETVRSLLGGKSVGPSFFLVDELARALRVELDTLAAEARDVG